MTPGFIRAEGWSDYYDNLDGGCPRSRSLAAPMLDARDMGPLFDRLRLGPMAIPLPVDQTRNITLATRTPRGMWEGVKLLWRLRRTAKTGKPILSYGGALQGRMLMLADVKGVPIRTSVKVLELIEVYRGARRGADQRRRLLSQSSDAKKIWAGAGLDEVDQDHQLGALADSDVVVWAPRGVLVIFVGCPRAR